MNAKRTPLSGLGARLAKKPADAVDPAPTQPDAIQADPAAPRERAADGRKGILVRARPEAWKALKLVALDREITLQEVMTEAINDLLTKHGRPPTA
ncbi:ribbon-helix-helix domain-containing protein [Lichenibacterium dinghuense]|uniref:ribbon-helix-helix domain-containing protein n=1 Tax=Lichenibacterium dinghuense TaxID=2895977 RepID=UPI001F47D568|nr:ribbon-helix-helix domain-containing protein [Lichenibacterium sp. 6Y81]